MQLYPGSEGWVVACLASNWFLQFCASRTISGVAETAAVMLALSYLPMLRGKGKQATFFFSQLFDLVIIIFCNCLVNILLDLRMVPGNCPGPSVAFLRSAGLFDQNRLESNLTTTVSPPSNYFSLSV